MALINTNINSSSETANGSSFGSFFKNGVPTIFIRQPKLDPETKRVVNQLSLRILPSFDFRLYQRPEFKTSVMPYRDLESGEIDKATRTPAFTPWAQLIRGYSFFGVNRSMFVSPLTGKAYIPSKKGVLYPPDRIDPIVDLMKYIRFHKDTVEPAALQLLEKDSRGFAAYPSGPSNFIISNAMIQDSETETWKFAVIAYTQSAYTDLINTLSVKTGRNETPVTPAFEDYLFGDITDVTTGSILTVVSKTMKFNSGGNGRYAGFQVSYDDKTVNGRKPAPALTESDLSKRVILNDDDYLDIWSYQQILDEIVRDGTMPISVIRQAMEEGCLKPGAIIKEELIEEAEANKAEEYKGQHAYSSVKVANASIPPANPTTPDSTAIPFAKPIGSDTFLHKDTVSTMQQPISTVMPSVSTVQSSVPTVQPSVSPVQQVSTETVDLTKDPEYAEYLKAVEAITTSNGNAPMEAIMTYTRLCPKFGQVVKQ